MLLWGTALGLYPTATHVKKGAHVEKEVVTPSSSDSNQRIMRHEMGLMTGEAGRLLRDGIILFVVLTIGLGSGFQAASHTLYRSTAQVFEDFMNSPLRILFPIAAALSAGWWTLEEVSHRFIASTRTRADIRRRLARRVVGVCVRVFLMFALVALASAFAAFVIVPAVWPGAIDPAGSGLNDAIAIRDADVSTAPLTALLRFGPALFSLAAAAWFGLNAAIFGLITVIAVFVFSRPVLALLFPLGLYLVESVILQLLSVPGASFLISAVYPAGLSHYDVIQALIPTVCLGVLGVGGAVVLVGKSRTNPRTS